MPSYDRIAISADGVPIHYEIHRSGSPALVFVHGWLGRPGPGVCAAPCRRSSRFGGTWRIGARPRVLDNSGLWPGCRRCRRKAWLKIGGADRPLAGWRADRGDGTALPDTVVGVIGVDTWRNLGEPRSTEAGSQARGLFRAHFAGVMRNRVQNMFSSNADPALFERVAAQTSSGQWRARLCRTNRRSTSQRRCPIARSTVSCRPPCPAHPGCRRDQDEMAISRPTPPAAHAPKPAIAARPAQRRAWVSGSLAAGRYFDDLVGADERQ